MDSDRACQLPDGADGGVHLRLCVKGGEAEAHRALRRRTQRPMEPGRAVCAGAGGLARGGLGGGFVVFHEADVFAHDGVGDDDDRAAFIGDGAVQFPVDLVK